MLPAGGGYAPSCIYPLVLNTVATNEKLKSVSILQSFQRENKPSLRLTEVADNQRTP